MVGAAGFAAEVAGFALVVVGLWMVFPPAGVVFAGVVLLMAAWALGR